MKWSTVCSSSSHGHIGLSISPNLYKYERVFPCPVSIVVNSGNVGIHICCVKCVRMGKRFTPNAVRCSYGLKGNKRLLIR